MPKQLPDGWVPAKFPRKLSCLFEKKWRYIVLHGGRGAAKSWGIARALLIRAAEEPLRILCAREIQNSIGESVHQLLKDQIAALQLGAHYEITNNEIRGTNGSLFFFAGLKNNIDSIKSKEGIDICWVEEAHKVSKDSWDKLTPTIRKEGSQIIISFNVEVEEEETYDRFVLNPRNNSIVTKLTYRDNPWFPEVLELERKECLEKDPVGYQNIWEGNPKVAVEGAVYKDELRVAQDEGRICDFTFDTGKPMSTYWDLGEADCMSIWIEQKIGTDRYLVDFVQDSLKKVPHYLEILQKKGYLYTSHVLPHDAMHSRANAEFTTFQLIKRAFPNCEVIVNPTFPGAVMAGIRAVRNVFPFLHFHKTNCRLGLVSMKKYHFKIDPLTKKPYGEEPDHDHSDAPDALRALAMAYRTPPSKKVQRRNVEFVDPDNWRSQAGMA